MNNETNPTKKPRRRRYRRRKVNAFTSEKPVEAKAAEQHSKPENQKQAEKKRPQQPASGSKQKPTNQTVKQPNKPEKASSAKKSGTSRKSKPKTARPQAKPEPKTTQRMFFGKEAAYELVAIAEEERLTDFWLHEESIVDRGEAGNIYRGVVASVIPALNAAFIDIGTEKHGFLPYDDYAGVLKKLEKRNKVTKKIENNMKPGDTVLVQVAKESIGDKGPMLTGKISMPGRFLVYMPFSSAVRMSRMLSDAQKKRFRDLVENKLKPEGGLIFRTASKGHSLEDIEFDFDYLKRAWKRLLHEYREEKRAKLLHKELEFYERIIRDNLTEDVEEIVIDHPRLKYRIAQFLKVIAPEKDPDKFIKFLTDRNQSIWNAYKLLKDFDRLFMKTIQLDCGGYIIIEEMETLTAIDVNSGKNISRKSPEEMILETNLEAAVEIPRQLRLRQIGGIIIIDFIDMRSKRSEDKVFKTLEREFAKDRTPSDIQTFTDLGIIQVTRQRLGKSLTQRLTFICGHCNGSGRMPSIKLS